jgi:predicted dehydrogenase
MATNENDCRQIVSEVLDAGVIFAVCHVLRYTQYTQKIKEIISEGVIGDVVSLQRLEPVGYWHQAHSFVHGNWRNEAQFV